MSATLRTHGASPRRALIHWATLAIALPLLLCITGCSHSPSFNILGSYFPSWIICCGGGAIATFIAHRAFTKWNMIGELWPLPLVYTALFSFVSCTLWLIFFN